MNSSVESKSFLVTGATGFIGSTLVRYLIGRKVAVCVLVRSKKDARFFGKPNRYLSFLEHDLATASQEELNRSLPKVSVVFHLAAAGVTNLSCDSKDLTAVNVLGTQKLLAAARDNGVQRFIYIGSCFEYGSGESLDESQELRPLSLYAKTKAEASRTVLLSSLLFDLGTVVLRPFMVYGPGEASSRLVPYLIQKALAGHEIKLTRGGQLRDFVFISDVIQAFMQAAELESVAGQEFNICSGHGVRVKTVAEMVLQLTKSKSDLILGALPYRANEAMSIVGSPEKALASMNWSAETNLEDGLAKTISHMTSGPLVYG